MVIILSTFICFIAFLDIRSIQQQRDVTVSSVKDESEKSSANDSIVTDIKLPEINELKDGSPKPLKFIAVGDILLGRTVKERVITKKERYLYPFLKVIDIMNDSDVVFGNLEESITSSTKSLVGINEGGKYILKNDIEAMNGIKFAGFNLLSLANNHILDYYDTGLFDTQNILSANNIVYAGAGKNLEEARK
ncbi:MAG: CapA family protein, partial [bacterium]|nr:CapA family protein [bacterium]